MNYETAKSAFADLAGATFVGMDTATPVKLKGGKKNPYQGRVIKVMTGAQVMSFSNENGSAYNAMVKRRLEAEGKDPKSFEVGPRAWGQRITGTPFVEHKGAYYLEVIFLRSGSVQYLLDGEAVDPKTIQGMPDRPTATQAGLDNTVIIRTFALENITALRTFGQNWS